MSPKQNMNCERRSHLLALSRVQSSWSKDPRDVELLMYTLMLGNGTEMAILDNVFADAGRSSGHRLSIYK